MPLCAQSMQGRVLASRKSAQAQLRFCRGRIRISYQFDTSQHGHHVLTTRAGIGARPRPKQFQLRRHPPYSKMAWFPDFHYRDLSAWHSDGLPLKSTASEESAKCFDAAFTQIVLTDTDPQYQGADKALEKALEADPNFLLAKTVACSLEVQGVKVEDHPDVVKKVYDLKEESKRRTNDVSKWESSHIDAVVCLAENNFLGACQVWEDILTEYPKDALALNFLYFGHIKTGRRRGLRDSVFRVINEYDPKRDRFYGHLNGMLCFGYQENLQFDESEKTGKIALEYSPRDVWAIHSFTHLNDETYRSKAGLDFINSCEEFWSANTHYNFHLFWHQALLHIQLGEYEAAWSIFEENVKPLAVNHGTSFPLSDATSLLLRLEFEHLIDPSKAAVLNQHWHDLGQSYLIDNKSSSVDSVFYDFHALVALLHGQQDKDVEQLIGCINKQSERARQGQVGYNYMVAQRVGVSLAAGVRAFHTGDYDSAVRHLNPIRYDIIDLLGGSHAQKDIIEMVLLQSALRAKNVKLAGQLIAEKVARNGNFEKTPLYERYHQKMVMAH